MWLGALMFRHRGKFGGSWNFGPGERDTMNVSDMIDLAIKRWGKGGMEMDMNEQPHESHLLKLDISKATAALKWHPLYDVNKAIDKTIQWYKAHYEKPGRNMYEYTLNQIDEYEEEGRAHKIPWSGLKRGETNEQTCI
jgi:CDP-glucose 4,6-dehydratase